MPSRLTSHSGRRTLALAGVTVGVAWVGALFVVATDTDPDVVVRPVESYDSDDLRRLADELALLRGTRLTPSERSAVGEAAEIVDSLATGDAVIAPASTTTPPTTRPTPTTTTTAPTTTTSTTTTAVPAPRPRLDLGDTVDRLADQLGVNIP